VWAVAQGNTYIAPWESVDFVAETRTLLDGIPNLIEVGVAPGDPAATGEGPDVALFLGLPEGLIPDEVRAVVTEVHARVSQTELFITRVDALTLTLGKLPATPAS
jgi:hypothetical protein